MIVRRTFCIALAVAAMPASLTRAQTTTETKAVPTVYLPVSLPSDAEVRALLVDRIDVQHKSVGTVVGIITPQGRRIVSYGRLNQGDPRPPSGDTVFEIGSATKIFTALLLADMVERGEVALTDPVAKYLPAGVKVPERNGRQITLVDLATHTSGLPFFPTNLPMDAAEYAKYSKEELHRILSNYTDEQLYRFLATYELPRDIGSHWQYSNLGFGLLGRALALRAGMEYEELVRSRITGPLTMTSTGISVSPEMKSRLAVGHDDHLRSTPAWDLPALPAAGSLRSSANDLLTFLAAFLNYNKSPLSPAMEAMLQTRRPGPGFPQALGWWIVLAAPGDEGIVAFGGQTFGYASTIAYDPKSRVGVVVLSNGEQDDGGLGWHILRPAFPVATSASGKAVKERKEITIDPKLFDLYAGQYQSAPPGGVIAVERKGDGLIIKFDTAPQGLRLHAESERKFFITETDLQVTFQTDSQGRPTSLVVHFAGQDYPAPRVEPGSEKK